MLKGTIQKADVLSVLDRVELAERDREFFRDFVSEFFVGRETMSAEDGNRVISLALALQAGFAHAIALALEAEAGAPEGEPLQ